MKKHDMKYLKCLVVFVIISMGITLAFFRTTVEATIFGTKNYYLALEKNNLKKVKNNLRESYLEKYLKAYSYSGKVNAELSGDLMSSDEEMKTIADYLSKFELSFNYNANGKDLKDIYYTALISSKYDGKKLMDVDIKSADNKTLIAFPELTDKTLGMENPVQTLKISQAFVGDDKAFKDVFGVTREDYSNLLEKYLKDIIINAIPDDNVVFDSEANFENIDCDSITFNIDQTIIANIYKAVAEELAYDKEFKTVLTAITTAFYEVSIEQQEAIYNENLDEKPTAEEIDEQIEMMCDELNDAAENLEEIQFSYTAYFKNDGDILSRQVKDKLSDTEVKFSTFKDLSGLDILSFKMKENKETVFELTNSSKLQNGSTYAGKLNIDITGKQLLEAEYTYEKDAKVGNISAFIGELEGKINLKQFDDSELTNYGDRDLNDIYFSFVNKKTDIDTMHGKTSVISKVNGKRMGVSIFTELKQSTEADIAKPEVSIDNSIKLTDEEGIGEFSSDILESLSEKYQELFSGLKFEDDSIFDDYEEDF